jgi:F0F1-type ATP synthase membrane subunit c/vacuolar-type H+-ATPase subunit K
MKVKIIMLTILFLFILTPIAPAFALNEIPIDLKSVKYLAAAITFVSAAAAASYAIAKAGSAGMAAAAERPEAKTTAVIITALGEALGIYGIVAAIIVLGG